MTRQPPQELEMIETAAIALLRKLASGVMPAERKTDPPSDHDTFSRLLASAKAGEARTGLPVAVDPSLHLALNADSIEQLSHIADIAQSRGHARVLVRDGDQHYILDVERRMVVQHATVQPGQLISTADAYVDLGSLASSQNATDDQPELLAGSTLLRALPVRTLN